MPETLAKFQKIKYNNLKEFSLLGGYKKAQEKGHIYTLVSYKVYKEVSLEIDKKIIGLNTGDGLTIHGKETHFIDRVIGQYQESDYPKKNLRKGVKLEDVIVALKTEAEEKGFNEEGKPSWVYIGGGVQVTVNPETGRLIQANPLRRGSK